MRIARVLDASDPRVDSKPINGARRRRTPLNPDRRRLSPDNELLLRVNQDEGPLTSIDRATLRSLGETPWDERPGFDGQSYAERHGVSHDELYRDEERYVSEEELVAVDRARDARDANRSLIDRLRKQHEDHKPIFEAPKISEPQKNLIERLLEQMSREVPDVFDVANNWYRDMHASGKMTRTKATEMIGRLKHHLGYEEKGWNRRPDWKPAREAAVDHSTPIDYFDDIPDAYYALRNDEGTVKFYRVSTFKRCLPGQSRPNRKVQLQSSDELHPVRAEAARRILREIREMKPREAAFLYGREIGRCCRCGRTLTDEVSRSMGIGPDCAAKSW